MAATFKIQICYPVELVVSDEFHRKLESGDPAVARLQVIQAIAAGGNKAHQEALVSAAITVLVSLKNGPQKVLFQNDTTKVILRG